MAGSTSFPNSLDDLNDSAVVGTGSPSTDNNNQAAAIKALEAKVGVNGSAVPTSLDYRINALEDGADAIDGRVDSLETGATTASTRLALSPSKQFDLKTIPAGLGWPSAFSYVIPALADQGGESFGSAGVTAESLFDNFSTARSAPANTYYVSVNTGNDSTGNGTSGAPWKSIWKATQAANTAGTASKVYVEAGSYPRANGFTNDAAAVQPAVDIAFIARNGQVKTGGYQLISGYTNTTNATYQGAYDVGRSNVNRVYDLKNLDRFGNPVELLNVSSGAQLGVTQNCWWQNSGTCVIKRADGLQPSDANTLITIGGGFISWPFTSSVPPNVFIGSEMGGLWVMEGGCLVGSQNVSTTQPTRKAMVFSNVVFRFAGGVASGGQDQGFGAQNWNGICALFNCRSDANCSDGINVHNDIGYNLGTVRWVLCFLTVNCAANDNGRFASVSNNGWTTHDNVVAIDIGGKYLGNRGGSVRSIDASKSYLLGTMASDLGDISLGGSVPPTAFRTDGTAIYWLEGCHPDMPPGTLAYAGNGAINLRECWPTRASMAGTIGSF